MFVVHCKRMIVATLQIKKPFLRWQIKNSSDTRLQSYLFYKRTEKAHASQMSTHTAKLLRNTHAREVDARAQRGF
jgi:hypothetical protein